MAEVVDRDTLGFIQEYGGVAIGVRTGAWGNRSKMTDTKTPQRVDPRYNPSYPHRVHTRERDRWNALTAEWTERVEAAATKLDNLMKGPKGEEAHRLFVQMIGSRDQIAEAALRLPTEVGSIYDEDRHLMHEAEIALKRLFDRWNALSA